MKLGRAFKRESSYLLSSLFQEKKKTLQFLAYVHNLWPVKYIVFKKNKVMLTISSSVFELRCGTTGKL